jgi:tetratricopeptide (TPR) repeat protein
MAFYDKEMHALSEIKNKIESHVLEMRSARHGKHSELLPESLDSYLDDLDNWIFSEEVDKLSKAEMEQKLKNTLDETREFCKAYFDAVKKEQEEKEKEMEEEAKRAQIERDGEEEDLDDHDNRRLPKKRRMEIVMKNKTEANELFSDGNFKFAAARYTKALSHCAKFVDLSPEDLTEVNGIKLSLNLNLALAYFKLENYDQALRVCNDALELDPDSAKALYRRASVYYEKKNWEAASKDIKKASSLAENDKAIMKLQERIDVQVKRQKEREKKMAKKMFG